MPCPLREWSQKCAATLTFSAEFWCFWLAADWPKHIAVAMVSAKCCLNYGECAKMCFRGVLKPQNVKNMLAAILFSWNMMKIHIEATEAPHCTFSSRARRKLTLLKIVFVFFNMATLFAQIMTSEATKCFKICWRPFCFNKIWWKYTLKPQKCRIVRLAAGRGKNSLVFQWFFCILQYG